MARSAGFLFGAEFNAELERGRGIGTAPASGEPFVEVRDAEAGQESRMQRRAWPVPASSVEVDGCLCQSGSTVERVLARGQRGECGHAVSECGRGGRRMQAVAGDQLHVHATSWASRSGRARSSKSAERAGSRPTWCDSTTVTQPWCSPGRTPSSSIRAGRAGRGRREASRRLSQVRTGHCEKPVHDSSRSSRRSPAPRRETALGCCTCSSRTRPWASR